MAEAKVTLQVLQSHRLCRKGVSNLYYKQNTCMEENASIQNTNPVCGTANAFVKKKCFPA